MLLGWAPGDSAVGGRDAESELQRKSSAPPSSCKMACYRTASTSPRPAGRAFWQPVLPSSLDGWRRQGWAHNIPLLQPAATSFSAAVPVCGTAADAGMGAVLNLLFLLLLEAAIAA
jgi:hypothetical protein